MLIKLLAFIELIIHFKKLEPKMPILSSVQRFLLMVTSFKMIVLNLNLILILPLVRIKVVKS